MYIADYNILKVPVTGLKICSWVASSGCMAPGEIFSEPQLSAEQSLR